MAQFISEDNIEQAILGKLYAEPFCYDDIVRCDPSPQKREVLPDGTGRSDKKQCILPEVFAAAIKRINPTIEGEYLDGVIKELSADIGGKDLIATNYKLYGYIRNGKQIKVRRDGKEDFDIVKLVDFDEPKNNTFTAVSQMWIRGTVYWHRPDIIIFVNGLPLVFIELKNSIVKVEEAYNVNLTKYKKDIPNLFAYNQICVLSNGTETRLGAFNASYEFFFEWLKVESEKEVVNRKALRQAKTLGQSSVKYFVDGLLDKSRLIDYIENFILFDNQSVKIIAQNHQYLGVNNLIAATNDRKSLGGKLGVFWHTQGSGKSYSMVMFVRKVRRKILGNFTFLVITDREDLDGQIYKTFIRTEVIGEKDEVRPGSGKDLREYLSGNKTIVFTLIHKFNYDKNKKYPVLSTRDDIIVLVDEAHRTQYKDLAENMRTALPNANYIAFTGTPLLGSKRLTNQWFGNYVSEYNFAQSVDDGSTVPLFYSHRVPEVWLTNDYLDDDIMNVAEELELSDDELRLLENSSSRVLEVIKRDDRLDKIAKDIAHHFPRRGFPGKGMVVSVDKYTAVKMYNKVQHYWEIEKQELIKERNAADTKQKRDKITKTINYMNNMEMAVIVSEENDEKEKFQKVGLDITMHRKKMNEKTAEGKDIEDRFKDENDKLQLVFVCAMWLTGFDVASLSTLYLDKPMKGHTLMQAIARANRRFTGKTCGIIVDYLNVFKYVKKALSDYATGGDGTEYPAKDMKQLISYIDDSIDEADEFLKSLGIDLDAMLAESDTFDSHEAILDAYNTVIAKDGDKDKCKVILNTLVNLYDAAKPEIFECDWINPKYAPLAYLHGLFFNLIDDQKIDAARRKMQQILDSSVSVRPNEIYNKELVSSKEIDLSKIDVEELRKEIKQAKFKAIVIDDVKAFIEAALEKMLRRNCTRHKFSEKYKNIIDAYNAGSTENEESYDKLIELMEQLKQEENRAVAEGLTDAELEIFDILIQGKTLTKAEEQKVKLSAKNLYRKLTENRRALLIVDWYKDEQPKKIVRSAIETSLNDDLPDSYDKETFQAKTDILLNRFIDMAVQGYGWIAA